MKKPWWTRAIRSSTTLLSILSKAGMEFSPQMCENTWKCPCAEQLLDDDFEKSLLRWLRPDLSYLIGVSGGRDSMALLTLLHKAGYKKLRVCHVNHQLRRGASDDDAAFVEESASLLGYPFFCHNEDVRETAAETKQSIETAARGVRHRFFAKIAAQENCPRLLLAHHADDQVETVLINFFRGTGLKGLGGMHEQRDMELEGVSVSVFRPLLNLRRSAIDAYIEKNKIGFREDESNQELFALRNRVRHRLIPQLREVFERDVSPSVLRLAELARLEESAAEEDTHDLCKAASASEDALAIPFLRSLSGAKRARVILHWLREQGVPDCGSEEVKRVVEIVMTDSKPAKANLPGNIHIRRRAGSLFLEKPS